MLLGIVVPGSAAGRTDADLAEEVRAFVVRASRECRLDIRGVLGSTMRVSAQYEDGTVFQHDYQVSLVVSPVRTVYTVGREDIYDALERPFKKDVGGTVWRQEVDARACAERSTARYLPLVYAVYAVEAPEDAVMWDGPIGALTQPCLITGKVLPPQQGEGP